MTASLARRQGRIWRRIGLWTGVGVYFASAVACIATAQSLGATTILQWTVLGFSLWPVFGAIILVTRPTNGVGWFLYALGLGIGLGAWTLVPEIVSTLPSPLEALTAPREQMAWPVLSLIGLVFPTGRIETRLGRTLAWLLVAFMLVGVMLPRLVNPMPLPSGRPNPFGLAGFEWLNGVPIGIPTVAGIAIVAGIAVDLGLRWRRAGTVQGLQYRWFVFGFAIVGVLLVIETFTLLIAPGSPLDRGLQLLSVIFYNVVPVSIGIAVTQHGLYSIGRVVSRTVSYAIVTLLVVGVYVGIVTGLTTLLPWLPSVGVALATLAAAALFLPVLRVVQHRVDRRFDRERYDARRVIDGFGERLRTEVDPSAAGRELVQAVEQALQPDSVGVWTNAGPR